MKALGIDLSLWDARPLDWKQAREVLSFVFIKISQGTNPDPLFRAHWDSARGYVLRSAYHYFDPRFDDRDSVDRTLEIYRAVTPGEIPPVLDLEAGDRETAIRRALFWLERWELKTGVRPIVYSAPAWLHEHNAAMYPDLKKYTIWLASYYYDKMSGAERLARLRDVFEGKIVPTYPAAVPPWINSPDFWQWTGAGDPSLIPGYYTGPGAKLEVDINFYNGSRQDLYNRYGELIPRTEEESLYKYSITPISSSGSRVRSDHYVIDSPIPNRVGSLAISRFAYGDSVWEAPSNSPSTGPQYRAGDRWLRVSEVDGVPLEGWIAEIHLGTRHATITTLQEEPPPVSSSLDVTAQITANVTTQGLETIISISAPGFQSRTVPITLPRS